MLLFADSAAAPVVERWLRRIPVGADQLIEAGGHGFGHEAVAEQGHAIADHNGAKARLYGSLDEDAIARNQLGVRGGEHKNGNVAVLHKQEFFIAREVGYRGLERDETLSADLDHN